MIAKPKISTVIPVYNVENYVAETIDSVLAQNIGFLDNIEVILVDDGSTDGSAEVCRSYVDRFPDNIQLIQQKNSGVSSARNAGLERAKGEYVHFFDSDDLISRDAYKKLTRLLDANESDIDFAALKIEFFDGRIGGHPLNFKFTDNRVIDVSIEPEASIMHMATCLIRRKSIAHKFQEGIKISEDVRFLSDLLLPNKKYGVVSDAYYFYRKRPNGGSAIDNARHDVSFYKVTPKQVYQYILDEWGRGDREIPLYAQHLVMYDMQWRLTQSSEEGLTTKAINEYRSTLARILKLIDDRVIISKKDVKPNRILFALKLKYGTESIPKVTLEQFSRTLTSSKGPEVALQFISVMGDEVELEGYILNDPLAGSSYAKMAGRNYELNRSENIHVADKFMGEIIDERSPFKVSIPISYEGGDIEFIRTSDTGQVTMKINPKRFTGLSIVRNSYTVRGRYIVSNKTGLIRIRKLNTPRYFISELVWIVRVVFSLRVKQALKQIYHVVKSPKRDVKNYARLMRAVLLPLVMLVRNIGTVFYRLAYAVMRPFYRKRDIWIVSDRTSSAGDNGEAFFRHVMSSTNHRSDTMFVISKRSSDYKRLRAEFGNRIVAHESLCYKLLFLQSTKIVSSQAEDHVINPFRYRLYQMNNLYTYDFVFLQHGIIKDDISDWLNRFNKNIRLFITSTQSEYDSILYCPYYYRPSNVLLSGLPRFDELVNRPDRKIILAPTWRHDLVSAMPLIDGQRGYSSEFKQSGYFKFFNGLINDPTLRLAMKKHGITGDFLLHPAFEAQVRDFKQSETFSIGEFPHNYKKAFSEGELLITDYSSVVFDFAYLGKPVMYVQRDRKSFFSGHTYKQGYFDYDKDGFGPVACNSKQAVDIIVAMIERNFTIEKKYKKRMDAFYKFRDRDNSKRVYDAICMLDES